MRIAFFLLIVTIFIGVGVLKQSEKKIRALEIHILKLKEKRRICEKNRTLACTDLEGDVVHLDCGKTFEPSSVTCFCTPMCLADYSAVMTDEGPEDCKHGQPNIK